MSTVAVVVPTYNERENLAALVPEILALGPGYRVIVVDDNSPDGTGQLADELAAAHPGRVGVVHRRQKNGLGGAYVAGLRAALRTPAGLIATMDADHSHRPVDLAKLVAAAANYDLVLGSRYVRGGQTPGWPWHRRLISRCGGLYARAVLGVPVNDVTAGFKVIRRGTLARINLDAISAAGFAFNLELTYRAWQQGARLTEVPIVFAERVYGESKLSGAIILEALGLVWRLRFGPRPDHPDRGTGASEAHLPADGSAAGRR